MILLGSTDASQGNEDYILAINANSTNIGNDLIKYRGLTLTKYSANVNAPSLFLGDLRAVNKQGYGLYSNNVYLTGSLTTQVGNNSYAGVNTLDGAHATKFTDDNSKIVFWAGAKSEEGTSIQEAPFQVTEEGSIYATRATLTSSLFVGGKIEGADLYAARIHGTGEDTAALSIYDTKGGISFRTGYGESGQESGQETCRITQEGFYSCSNIASIIFDAQAEINNSKTATTITTKRLQLSSQGLYCYDLAKGETGLKTGVKINNNEIVFITGSSDKIVISEAKTIFENEIVANKRFGFGERGYYSETEGGIDLYIQEVRVNG